MRGGGRREGVGMLRKDGKVLLIGKLGRLEWVGSEVTKRYLGA